MLELYHLPVSQLHTVVAPASVDLIVTDPPYPRKYLACWGELAEFAAYALREGGSLYAMTGQFYLPEVIAALGSGDLRYVWQHTYRIDGRGSQVYDARKVHTVRSKPILRYAKGQPQGYAPDTIISPGGGVGAQHKWQQAQAGIDNWVAAVAQPGQLICDPFLGAGTTAIAARKRGCGFIGADIDANCLDTTRGRLAGVPVNIASPFTA